jgi:DNA-binding MarR family transcriptional regulator
MSCTILYMNSTAHDASNPSPEVQSKGELVLFSLLEAAHALENRIDSELSQLNLSISKYMTLRHLAQAQGGMSLSALADCRKCVRSNITQLIDRLVADGFVERANDPSDRRTTRAQMTPLGAERYAAATAALQSIEAELAKHVANTSANGADLSALLSTYQGT